MTALHLAALSGTLACVQLLLEAGASMMVSNTCSWPAAPHHVAMY